MVYHAKKIVKKYLSSKQYTAQTILSDLIAGITVALILIPQSLAYAQLAGLPSQYGLYAAFLPPVIASVFGSSRFLGSGPVAVISLLTASALSSLPASSEAELMGYAITLALLVGVIQFLMGIFKLGMLVHFISHPVIIGFINAAALIIATSQLPKLFGVSVDNYEHYYETMYNFLIATIQYIHWLSLFLALLAFCIMYFLKRYNPRLPGMIIAVVVCTLVSIYFQFEQKATIPLQTISSTNIIKNIEKYNTINNTLEEKTQERLSLTQRRRELTQRDDSALEILNIEADIAKLDFELEEINHQAVSYRKLIRSFNLSKATDQHGNDYFMEINAQHGRTFFNPVWKINVGENPINPAALSLHTGGSVVGKIPQGLPSISLPAFNLSIMSSLFSSALVIAVLGFMESIAIARSLAVKVGDKIDANRELRAQGLANIASALTQGFPISGSFSRTAVNFQSGAQSPLSSVFTAFFVLLTLLFFTPLLSPLPQPVLAATIILSVVGLINFDKMFAIWKVNRNEGIIALVTFVSILFFAPHLDKGIMLGIIIATGYYIYTRTRPRIVQLSADTQDILHDITLYKLTPCKHIAIIRFDGSLFFANTAYLENSIQAIVNDQTRDIKAIVLLADGINYLDFSGIEALARMAKSYRESGYYFLIGTIKSHILHELRKSDEMHDIDEDSIYLDERVGIRHIYRHCHEDSDETDCPLKGYVEKD